MKEERKVSEIAEKILRERYYKRNEKGERIEGFEGMMKRVASIAQEPEKEKKEKEYYEMLKEKRFIPNSPTLFNAPEGQLSACYVIPVPDSLEGIMEAMKKGAMIQAKGGGCGYAFSRLRAKGERIKGTGGKTSGAVSFMKMFSAMSETIKQGGKRRGANMGVLRIDHPEIMEFIKAKDKKNVLNNFNISVAVTEKFMNAMMKGEEYSLKDPRTGKKVGTLNAKKVWEKIIKQAWKNGEPGMIFIDEINKHNPIDIKKRPEWTIESTNPCGEASLSPYESCNLGSINLLEHVKGEVMKGEMDWEKLRETVRTAIEFLDDVVTINHHAVPEVSWANKQTRKLGLGVMGLADALIWMGIKYDTEEGIKKGEEIMAFIQKEALKKSEEMGKEKGSFPMFEDSTLNKKNGGKWEYMRNAAVTSIAPTGTISIIAGVSSGIEPLYSLAFVRTIMGGKKFFDVDKVFEEVAKKEGFYSEELIRKVSQRLSIQEMEEIPAHVRRLFVTASDIKPYWHIRMQAAFQKHVSQSVSKTINFNPNATIEEVEEAYLMAYEYHLKGITVYRDNSRANQPLSIVREGVKEERKQPIKERKILLMTNYTSKKNYEKGYIEKCPICGTAMYGAGGCYECPSCGYARCG